MLWAKALRLNGPTAGEYYVNLDQIQYVRLREVGSGASSDDPDEYHSGTALTALAVEMHVSPTGTIFTAYGADAEALLKDLD